MRNSKVLSLKKIIYIIIKENKIINLRRKLFQLSARECSALKNVWFAFSEMAKDKYLLILILFCLDWVVGNDHQFEYLATYFDTKGQKLSFLNELLQRRGVWEGFEE